MAITWTIEQGYKWNKVTRSTDFVDFSVTSPIDRLLISLLLFTYAYIDLLL